MREEKKMRKLLESALRVMEQDERQIDGIKCCSLNSFGAKEWAPLAVDTVTGPHVGSDAAIG